MRSSHGGKRVGAGRKPDGLVARTSTLAVRLPESSRVRLRALAERRECTESDLVREWIARGLREAPRS